MAGKNKIERSIKFYWDDSGGTARDITHDLIPGTLNAGGKSLEEVDMTGVSQGVRNFLGGFANSEVSAQFHFDDTATTGAHTVFKTTMGVVGTVTVEYGSSGSAPTTGDPTWSGEYVLLEATVAQNAGRLVYNCTWQPSGGTDPAWGTKA